MVGEYTPVPLGRAGTGEAVILPQDRQFTEFSKQIVNLRAKESQEQKQQEQQLKKLLDEDLGAKWTSDAIQYFQPKLDAFRKESIDIYKQTRGKLSPMQMYEIQGKFNKLKQEVGLNNELYKQEIERAQQLQKDAASGSPTLNQEASMELRRRYANPWSDPEYAQDIQENYGGNVNAWRAANQHLFENVRAFSPEAYINKTFKDKVSEDYVVDEQGRPIQEKTKEGRAYYTKVKAVPLPKIDEGVNTVFKGNTYEDKQFQKTFLRNADKVGLSYSDKGVPSMTEQGWDSKEQYDFMADQISKAPELASMNAAQQKQWAAKKLAAFAVKNNFPETRAIDWYDPRKTGKGGAGASTKKEEVTIPSDYYNTVTEAVAGGSTPLQIAQAVGGKLVDKGQISIPIEPSVAVKSIEVGADKVLTQQQGKYRPLNEKGLVAGTPKSAVIMFKKNGVTVPMNTEGAKPYFQVIMQPVKGDKKASVPSIGGGEETSITGEVNRQILENNARVFKKDKFGVEPVFKVEYDLSDPVQNALVSKLYYGGTTISSNQYRREKENIAQPQPTKNTPTFKMK